MIPLLLYACLLTLILPIFSLNITVPTQPHPLVNDTTSVLLTYSPDDPSHFWLVVHVVISPNGDDIPSIQPVVTFTATRNISLDFRLSGNTFIEALKTSPTNANTNESFAQTEPFQVDNVPTGDIKTHYMSTTDSSSLTASTTGGSTDSSSTTKASPSASKGRSSSPAAIIAGVVCGAFLFASLTTVFLIWRYRKRRSRAPSRAFLNNLDYKRHPRTARNDQPLNDPPPAYSPPLSRAASKLFRWARGDDESTPLGV